MSIKEKDKIKKHTLLLSDTEINLISDALSCYLVGELPLKVSPYYKEVVEALKNNIDLIDSSIITQ